MRATVLRALLAVVLLGLLVVGPGPAPAHAPGAIRKGITPDHTRAGRPPGTQRACA